MTGDWFSARQLAGLPGMPATSDGVTRRAARDHWQSRPRQARGGGSEYPLHVLPPETRAFLLHPPSPASCPAPAAATVSSQALDARPAAGALSSPGATGAAEGAALRDREQLARDTCEAARRRVREDGLAGLARLQGSAKARAEQRQEVIAALQQFAAERKLPLRTAIPEFCSSRPHLSARTVWRWHAAYRKGGAAALAGGYRRDPRSPIDRSPELRAFILAMIADHPHASAAHIASAVRARFPGARCPSEGALRRWTSKWKAANFQAFTAHANPDAWKGRYMAAYGSRSEDITRLNQRWEFDSTPADVMLLGDPGTPDEGRPVRHTVTGVVDVWSRRAKLLVSRTSKSAAVALLTRRALLDWGVPETAKTDNGKEFVSKHMTRVFHGLGVEHRTCAPFSPWEKPHVERFFRTFSHDLVELLHGYIGHNVTDRTQIRDRRAFSDRLFAKDGTVELAMTSGEFQEFCDRWTANVYHRRAHAGLGCSPFEQASKWTSPVRTVSNERALDILLAEAPGGDGWRTVGKGGIRIDGFDYIHPELALHAGAKCHVRYDPDEMSRVYVFGGPELDFVCAAECAELTGVSRKEVAARAREKQKAMVQAARAELRANARRHRTKDIAMEILGEREGEAAHVVAFPPRREEHSAPGLASASAAAAPVEAGSDEPLTAAEERRLATLVSEDEFRRRRQEHETPEARFARWLALQEVPARDRAPDDASWAASYETSAEFAGQKLVWDFERGARTESAANE